MNIGKNADVLATTANPRAAYAGELLLTANHSASTDAWQTGLNNNVLVLGCSGGGKTRNHLVPNLLQCQGSYVVLDGKGTLYDELAPYLRANGYQVDQLDFTREGAGTVGYDPLAHVRWSHGRPNTQDVIAVANAVCSAEDMGSDPFWGHAAANYLASYVAYVLEKMHASIMGIIAADILPFSHEAAMASYERPQQVDFAALGHKKCALFVTMDDLDHSLTALTSLFLRQAFCSLCDEADASEGGRLPVPVRFMLDDFANLRLPDFDDVLSVIRSREISCTVVCQTVSQLEARYGEASANSIVGNCDRHLVLAFQDERTARYFSTRAGRTVAVLPRPEGRGRRGVPAGEAPPLPGLLREARPGSGAGRGGAQPAGARGAHCRVGCPPGAGARRGGGVLGPEGVLGLEGLLRGRGRHRRRLRRPPRLPALAARVVQVAADAVVVGAVGGLRDLVLGVHRAQVALGDLLAPLVDDHGVPVAALVGGPAQLAGQGELGVPGALEEGRLADGGKTRTVNPEADERALVGVGERVALLVVDVANKGAAGVGAQQVHLAWLELEGDGDEYAGVVVALLD